MNTVRVVLADDHQVVRTGLRALVHAAPGMQVVGEAGDGREAVARARELKPDVLVMDVSMPGMDGAQATEQITRGCPGVKVIALSAHDDRAHVTRLLQAGAAGYVLKRAAADELVRAIRTVGAGGTYVDPVLAGTLLRGAARPFDADRPHAPEALSEREEEVLRWLRGEKATSRSPPGLASAPRRWKRTRPASPTSWDCAAVPRWCATPSGRAGFRRAEPHASCRETHLRPSRFPDTRGTAGRLPCGPMDANGTDAGVESGRNAQANPRAEGTGRTGAAADILRPASLRGDTIQARYEWIEAQRRELRERRDRLGAELVCPGDDLAQNPLQPDLAPPVNSSRATLRPRDGAARLRATPASGPTPSGEALDPSLPLSGPADSVLRIIDEHLARLAAMLSAQHAEGREEAAS